MKRILLSALALLVALPAAAEYQRDRAIRVATTSQTHLLRYAATALALAPLDERCVAGAHCGSGGTTSIVIGTTPATGGTNGGVFFESSDTITNDAGFTYVAGTDTGTIGNLVVSTALTNSALTATRVTFAGTAGLLADDADMTFAIDTLTVTKIAATTFTGLATFSANTSFGGTNIHTVVGGTGGSGGGITFGSTLLGRLQANTSQTPDSFVISTGTTGNNINVMEDADTGSDLQGGPCGTAACVDPAITIHSAVANTTTYNHQAAWGSARKFHVTLTEVPTNIITIPVAAEVGTAGILWYSIYATDGATPQLRFGYVTVNVTADGATETCVLGTPVETDNSPTGTLTVAIACDTGGSNSVTVTFDPETSLAFSTLEAYVSFDLFGPGLPARP